MLRSPKSLKRSSVIQERKSSLEEFRSLDATETGRVKTAIILCLCDQIRAVASLLMGHWGTCPLKFCKFFAAVANLTVNFRQLHKKNMCYLPVHLDKSTVS